MKYVNDKLQEFEQFLKNKNVAVIGLEKSNLPLLDYFYKKGANVTIFDNRVIDDIDKEILDKITDRCMRFSLGEHCLINLVGYDVVFKGPDCDPNLPEIKAEQLRGAVVISEIEIVLELAPGKVIGVTGSNEQDAETTAKLIYEILKENGNNCYLGGNIGDVLLSEIENMDDKSIIVLQAEGMQLFRIQSSPNIAVILNVDEPKQYYDNMYKFQKEDDILVLNYDTDIRKNLIAEIPSKIKCFSVKNKLDNGIVYDKGIVKKCEDGVRRHIVTVDDAISVSGDQKIEIICAAIAATSKIVEPNMQARAVIKYKG